MLFHWSSPPLESHNMPTLRGVGGGARQENNSILHFDFQL